MVPGLPGKNREPLFFAFYHAGLSRTIDAGGYRRAWLPEPVRLTVSITDQGEKEVYVSRGHNTEYWRVKAC